MKTFIAAVVGVLALFVSADAAPRRVGAFSAIEAGGRFKVEVVIGPHQSVDIVGADADEIAAAVRGDELLLTPTRRTWFGPEPAFDAVVRITTPRLDRLQAMRGAEVSVTNLSANAINLDASMGGQLEASGVCSNLRASASMGGMVDARALQCANANASASMGGMVDVHAREGVDASASMGGSVDVRGAPARRSSHAAMGGAVNFSAP